MSSTLHKGSKVEFTISSKAGKTVHTGTLTDTMPPIGACRVDVKGDDGKAYRAWSSQVRAK